MPKSIIDLSIEGIKYGAMLHNISLSELEWKLYSYNTIPVSKNTGANTWSHHTIFPQAKEWNDYVDILSGAWVPVYNSSSKYWLSWKPKKEKVRFDKYDSSTYKLYISPHINDYTIVLAETIKVLTSFNVYAFKTGSNLHGIARPDKIVAYFDTYEELQKAAIEIEKYITAYVAHGVPFSIPFNDAAMLSWGIDPPANFRKENGAQMSWRTWITAEIATGIADAKKKHADELWLYALQYMQSRGIDIDTWQPIGDIFIPKKNIKK